MGQNLRGEMVSDLAGAKLCLSDSRFIQVIAKSLSISCKEVTHPHNTDLRDTQLREPRIVKTRSRRAEEEDC